MAKHSKNASCRVYFGNKERERVNAGTQTVRLGSDSLRPFDACCLCNKPCFKPTTAKSGYIYCYECILDNLLQQKKESERKRLEAEEKALEEEIKKVREAEQEHYVKMEKRLDVLSSSSSSSSSTMGKNNAVKSSHTSWMPNETANSSKSSEKPKKKSKTIDPMNPKESRRGRRTHSRVQCEVSVSLLRQGL